MSAAADGPFGPAARNGLTWASDTRGLVVIRRTAFFYYVTATTTGAAATRRFFWLGAAVWWANLVWNSLVPRRGDP